MEFLDPLTEWFGGGAMTPIMLVGGAIALYVAFRVARFVMRLAALAVAAVLFVGTAPLTSGEVTGPVATCAMRAVEEPLGWWQTLATKRITVEELSDDARCSGDEQGLAAGEATVKLRTFYDVPIQTWAVSADGARAERFG